MQRACNACGVGYEAQRSSSKYCSERCKKRGQRSAAAVIDLPIPPSVAPATDGEPSLVSQVRSDLTKAEVLDTSLGQMALDAAGRVANSRDTGSSYASLLREARAVLAEALRAGRRTDSAIQGLEDELAARRMA